MLRYNKQSNNICNFFLNLIIFFQDTGLSELIIVIVNIVDVVDDYINT